MINQPPTLLVRSNLFGKIKELAKDKPNDMDFGKAVRVIMNDYNNGKYVIPSDIEFDESDEK